MQKLLARMRSDAHSMMTWPDSRHGFVAHENGVNRAHQGMPVQKQCPQMSTHGRASATAKASTTSHGEDWQKCASRQNRKQV